MRVLKSAFLAFLMFTSTTFASYAPNIEVFIQEEDLMQPVILETIPVKQSYTYDEILMIAEPVAKKYNVSLERMMYTMKAESNFKNVQSSCHKNEFTNCGSEGVREESYGLAQFNISTLSKREALDPYIAIDRMGYYFSKGEACRWTEYKKKYGCTYPLE